MCGRFDFHGDASDLAEFIAPGDTLPVAGSYNLGPMRLANVITGNGVLAMRFGWRRRQGGLMINARSESLQGSGSYGRRRGPVVVVANGFYEWRTEAGHKQPYYFTQANGALCYLAAVTQNEPNETDETPRTAFAIITQEADTAVREIHPRMPWVLPHAAAARHWLQGEAATLARLQSLRPTAALARRAVSPQVNSSKVDGPQCIAAV